MPDPPATGLRGRVLPHQSEAASRYELFLETKGYYLEWMRKEWFAEENLVRAAELFLNPEGALRRLAPEFKREEPYLEAAFWRSKYVRP